jgi:adenylosuccinate lyase
VLAEAAYLLLALSGHPDSHEEIRKISLAAEQNGTDFVTQLRHSADVWGRVSTQLEKVRGQSAAEFFSNPGSYCGLAADKARTIGNRYRSEMNELKERLAQ